MEAVHRAVSQAMAPIMRRVQMSVGRALIAAVNSSLQTQLVQLNLLAGETSGQLEQFQEYGFASVPFAQAEAAVVFVNGDRSHGLVIATQDRRYRLTTLVGGEVALYDDQGQAVTLKRTGVVVTAPKGLTGTVGGTGLALTVTGGATIVADTAVIKSQSIDLGATGGKGVARIGDAVSGGVITGGSTKVRSA